VGAGYAIVPPMLVKFNSALSNRAHTLTLPRRGRELAFPSRKEDGNMNTPSKDRARELRKNLTDAERALWQHLRHRQIGGQRFRRQHPIGPYIVDFFCFEKRLIVEIDGGQHSEQVAYDEERTKWLEARGFRVLRFWNNDVLGNIEGVKQVILEELTRSSSSAPPP
jgi:very-short-patch-repair endonuclease